MKRSMKIAIVLGILCVLAGVAYAFKKSRANGEIVYREVRAKKETIEITVLSTGTVEPQNRLAIKPPVAGRVEEVLVKEGESVKRGQILAWMSSSERAAMLDAARSDGSAAVKRWEKNYKPTPIMAPIDGTIILRNVETGQTFTNTDAVFTMSDRLTVKAQVDETDIGKIKVGQNVRLTLDAYPERDIQAKVDQIAFDAQTVNNVTTYVVEVLPAETPEIMRSGMTVNVNFEVTKREDVVAVPNEAIKTDGGKSTVLVKGPGGEMKNLEIATGITDGKKTEVSEGLAENDVVLIAEKVAAKGASGGANPFMPSRPKRRGK
jgi:macrolide-specific efflux system membrane fusion protein